MMKVVFSLKKHELDFFFPYFKLYTLFLRYCIAVYAYAHLHVCIFIHRYRYRRLNIQYMTMNIFIFFI